MKKKNIKSIFVLSLVIGLLGSCKPEAENVMNMFDDVKVTFHGDHPLSVTDYKLVNDGDSVYIDYTIASQKEDMFSIMEERVAVDAGTSPRRVEIVLSEQNRKSYTGRIKLKMQRDGKSTFRVYARDRVGDYIGDGYKKVTIEGRPSFMVYATRRIYAPDTTAKVLPAYFSLSTGASFNYMDGSANTDKIDFGIWRHVRIDAEQRVFITYNYYSLTAPSIPWNIYDMSGWSNKRATQFSTPVKSHTDPFIRTLTSGSLIEEAAKSRGLAVRATNYTTPADGLAPGNVVYFMTPEGKYGAFIVNQVTEDLDKRPFLSVTVKIQN